MKKWTEDDIKFIRDNCNVMINKQFADHFGCSIGSIESIMRRNGIKRSVLNTKPYSCKSCGTPIGMTSKSMLCKKCYREKYNKDNPDYFKNYYRDGNHRQIAIERSKQWWIDNHDRFLENSKKYREKINFDSLRETVLKRDNYTCVICNKYFGKENSSMLVVHHKDKQGRNKKMKNNDIENLETLCKACHMNEHRKDLLAGKQQKKI